VTIVVMEMGKGTGGE